MDDAERQQLEHTHNDKQRQTQQKGSTRTPKDRLQESTESTDSTDQTDKQREREREAMKWQDRGRQSDADGCRHRYTSELRDRSSHADKQRADQLTIRTIDAVRAGTIAELVPERAGPIIHRTFFPEIDAFRQVPAIWPARGAKHEMTGNDNSFRQGRCRIK